MSESSLTFVLLSLVFNSQDDSEEGRVSEYVSELFPSVPVTCLKAQVFLCSSQIRENDNKSRMDLKKRDHKENQYSIHGTFQLSRARLKWEAEGR